MPHEDDQVFTGLKVRIGILLLVLLTIGVLLGNVVSVLFWQNSVVRGAVDQSRTLLAGISYTRQPAPDSVDFSVEDLSRLCRSLGSSCAALGLYSGAELHGAIPSRMSAAMHEGGRLSAASGEETVLFKEKVWVVYSHGNRFAYIARPLQGERVKGSALVMGVDLAPVYQRLQRNQKIIFSYLLVNVLILAILGLYRMFSLIVKPVESMIRSTENYLSATDGLFLGAENDQSEFGQLKLALNSMFGRIASDKEALEKSVSSLEEANKNLVEAHREMVRAEKLASVGRLSAGLAHEIGNPVGIIQGYVELLKQPGAPDEEREQFGKRALQELERINRLISQLLNYARSAPQEMNSVAVDGELFEGVMEMVALEKESAAITVESTIAPGLQVRGDREALRQVMLNSLLNSVDAIKSAAPANGSIRISAESVTDASGTEQVEIRICDNGTGIEPAHLDKLYDPFFTTKETGKGTGLGLFVSHSIIEAHDGKLWLENNEEKGVTLFVTLPVYQAVSGNERD